MRDDDLCYMTATEALARFRDRSLSPVELTKAVVARAEAIGDAVNPFADRYFDEATDRAKTAEAKYAKSDGRPRRLEGLPLAVKEGASIRGRRTTGGSLIDKDSVARKTDVSVARLLRSGANLFARTTMPEFGWLYTTQSRRWGVTRNPWRLDVTPGGSSGGSAAALAAGAATITTGGDSTGSIRQPASQCGIVGYKPPYGRIPIPGDASFNTYLQVGPMTRGVADAALMSTIMAGPDPRDHNALTRRLTIPLEPKGIAGLRIATSIDLGHYHVVDDVRRETAAALEALAAAGAEVVEVPFENTSELIRLAHGNQEFLFAGDIEDAIRDHGDLVSDYVPQLAETARSFSADDYRRSLTLAGAFWHDQLGPILGDFDAFICPTVSCPEVPAANWQKDTIVVDGHELTDTDMAMTSLFNMFSRCPVLAVPSGMTDAGLPTGLQIVGRPYDDAMAFRVGSALERARPWLDTASRRPTLAAMTAPVAAA